MSKAAEAETKQPSALKKTIVAKPLSIVSTLVSECLACNGRYDMKKGWVPSTQFVELKGIRFIGLGAVVDELSPRERVYDTLEVFRARTQRLVSVGFLLNRADDVANGEVQEKITETVPLDAWTRDFPDEKHLSNNVKKMITLVRVSAKGLRLLRSDSL